MSKTPNVVRQLHRCNDEYYRKLIRGQYTDHLNIESRYDNHIKWNF